MVKRVKIETVEERFVDCWVYADGIIMHRKSGEVLPVYQNGSVRVSRVSGGDKEAVTAHRLVAKAFVPNPNGYNFVRFKNGNTSDRRAVNLEWISSVRGKSERTNEIIECWKQGMTTAEIAYLVGVTSQFVNKKLREMGLKGHKKNG